MHFQQNLIAVLESQKYGSVIKTMSVYYNNSNKANAGFKMHLNLNPNT